MRPFGESDTHTAFRNLVEKVTKEIHARDNEYVLKASASGLEEYFIDRVIIEPLVLHTEEYCIENRVGEEIDVSHDFRRGVYSGERAVVPGTRLDIAIPYEGDPLLWRIRASTYSLSGYPEIEVRDDVIVFSVTFPDDSADSDNLKSEIERQVKSLADAVSHLRHDVDDHNRSAQEHVKVALQKKREVAKSTIGTVEALGIPVKRRDKPLTYTVPVKRRKSPAESPKVATEPYKLDPELDEKEYQHILKVMRSMAVVIERNPEAFAGLTEELIRTFFLLQLNGHYEGTATGETFNASGKTDILIRVEDRNIFIAECKFWHGPKAFDKAIDQLLSYLSWRDTKSALLVFNRTQDSTAVRRRMHEVMENRTEHIKTISHDPDGDSRYVFVKESDPGREIIITTHLYDIPRRTG